MKKTICLLLTALLLCALLGSCGKKTISEVDLTLTVGGTAVRPDTSVSALLDAFGTDYTYSEAVSCVYTGMDKTYAYSDRILYTYPDGDADRLLELYCTADVQTAQGVGIGAKPERRRGRIWNGVYAGWKHHDLRAGRTGQSDHSRVAVF